MSRRARSLLAVLLAAVGAAVGAAEAPPQLVKPVVPARAAVRARIPIAEDQRTAMQLKAQIAGPKGKMIDVTVLLESLPQTGTVSLKKWKEWGFEVPADRVGVIPELIVAAAQVAPKPAKGRDIEVRLANVKVNIVEPPGGGDANAFELFLSLGGLTGGAERRFEPRLHFADKFLELTVPATAVKRLSAGDATSPDPQATADDKLVPAVGTMQANGYPVFAFASVNGYTRYTAAGRVEAVNVGVSSTSNYAPPGILMTVNTARGCGVEMENLPGDGEIVPGKVKELRLAVLTGAGLRAPKDFVLKDVTVHVNSDRSQPFVWLGPRFVEEYFADGVYGCGSDGVWRLHGRVKPAFLEDTKTRTPPKKP